MVLLASFANSLSNLVSKYWYIALGLIALLLVLTVILFIVIACKNKRIRKLKEDNKKTRLKLEMERSRAKNEQMYAPVTGTQLFDEQQPTAQTAEQQPTQTAEQPQPTAQTAPVAQETAAQNEAAAAQNETTQGEASADEEKPKKQPKPEPTVIPVQRQAAEEPSFITRDLSEGNDDAETVTEEIESEPEQQPVKRRKPPTAAQEEIDRAANSVSYFNRTSVISPKNGTVKFTVKYDRNKDTWVIKKDGVDKVVRRVDTKEEAMNIARALCKKYNASLVVHKKDGKFQRQ